MPEPLLLDTHVLVWLLSEPDRLGRRCRDAIAGSPAVHVSSISHVELHLKAMSGKLTLPDRLADRLRERGLRALHFTDRDAAALQRFPVLLGHDPFDRMLVSQAQAQQLTFLTADRRLLALDAERVLDARS